jgi:nucleoside 2-deoxyribosyltransferase
MIFVEVIHMKRIYFAAPLFTQAEWLWNQRLAIELTKLNFEIILPQKRAEPMLFGTEEFNPLTLFDDNVAGIDASDLVLAVFDQADPDSGTCWECGYAYKSGKPIIGVRTDLRRIGDDSESSINLMLSKSCKALIEVPFDKREDLVWVAQSFSNAVKIYEF